MVGWPSLEVWQFLVTSALGVATVLIYLSLMAIQKDEAEATRTLASIATLQDEKSQARLEVVPESKYPFQPDPVHDLRSHPAFAVQLANTGWKDSDLLRCKALLLPARQGAHSAGSPHSEILREGEHPRDLFLPAGRLGRFRISLEPQHLKDPFRFGDYHVAFSVYPVNGVPAVSVIKNPNAEIPCPEDWEAQLESAKSRHHP